MTKIERPLYKATVAEASDLSGNVSKAIANKALDDSYLNTTNATLSTRSESMAESISRNLKKKMTEEIEASDSKRDGHIAALKLFCRAFMSWNNGSADAAALIYEVLKRHGLQMAHKNLEEESGLIAALLSDLEATEMQEALAQMNIGGLVVDLKAEQEKFNGLMLASAEAEASKPDLPSATEIKKSVYDLLVQVVNYLNVMSTANPEAYGSLTGEVAELVNSLNAKIRARYN